MTFRVPERSAASFSDRILQTRPVTKREMHCLHFLVSFKCSIPFFIRWELCILKEEHWTLTSGRRDNKVGRYEIYRHLGSNPGHVHVILGSINYATIRQKYDVKLSLIVSLKKSMPILQVRIGTRKNPLAAFKSSEGCSKG